MNDDKNIHTILPFMITARTMIIVRIIRFDDEQFISAIVKLLGWRFESTTHTVECNFVFICGRIFIHFTLVHRVY